MRGAFRTASVVRCKGPSLAGFVPWPVRGVTLLGLTKEGERKPLAACLPASLVSLLLHVALFDRGSNFLGLYINTHTPTWPSVSAVSASLNLNVRGCQASGWKASSRLDLTWLCRHGPGVPSSRTREDWSCLQSLEGQVWPPGMLLWHCASPPPPMEFSICGVS